MSPTYEMGAADAVLPQRADIVIVGGGVMGLSTAYQLMRQSKGRLKVVVIERSYLVSGASGRNGGGVRMQWADRQNVELMMRSIDICRGLAQELGINTWFRQGGYLFLARTPAAEAQLERNAELHHHVGAPTRLLSPEAARDRVPQLDVTDVRVATYNPDDAVVFPWAFVWGYAAQAVKRGAVVRTHTSVERIEPDPGGRDGFTLHLSTGESIEADTVINATGAWSVGLNVSLGVHLPNHPHRHEIMSSEPLKPFLDPLVVDLDCGLYFSQSTRGEIVAGVSMPSEGEDADPTEINLGSSMLFLGRLSRALCRAMPIARSLKVLRQWSGPYDVSPDGDAILGRTPAFPNLIQICGFTGHGFMMAPVIGEIVARNLVHGKDHPVLTHWSPGRFDDPNYTGRGETMIIG
ncbi:MAG: NAD(P)/FAD-dependent oxidoreductase [Nannocystales bacterium]